MRRSPRKGDTDRSPAQATLARPLFCAGPIAAVRPDDPDGPAPDIATDDAAPAAAKDYPMRLKIDVTLDYNLDHPTDLLLQIEAAAVDGQRVISQHINVADAAHFGRVAAQEGIGQRIWVRTDTRLLCTYTATCDIDRPEADLGALNAVAPHRLPGDTVRYLLPSRYCPSDEFLNYVAAEFGGFTGGARIVAMRDWIARHISYVPGSSGAKTTALETFVQRQGVCRDFAHLLVTLARASVIPARVVAVYAPDVMPQDFHAIAEVYLDGAWHLVDATGMSRPGAVAVVGVGADAAEIAFLTTYGPMYLNNQSVSVVAEV